MSDSESFAVRWSRLKREMAKEQREAGAAQSGPQPSDAERTSAAELGAEEIAPAKGGQPPEPAFDPASLPPIESITAESDIRAFLQSGVPAELTKAALRRLWTTDPAIRDFIGIAENQWDFTDPTAMPGFGPLEATDDVRELVAQAMGKLDQITQPSVETADSPPADGTSLERPTSAAFGPSASLQVSGRPEENEKVAPIDGAVKEQNETVHVAPQQACASAEGGVAPNRRTHGSALPQ